MGHTEKDPLAPDFAHTGTKLKLLRNSKPKTAQKCLIETQKQPNMIINLR